MKSSRKLGVALAVVCLSLAAPAVGAAPPKLTVVLVVDQLGYQTLEAMRPHLGPDGIERLLREGTSYTQAGYAHASTYTAPGHACIASGSYGHRNGIIGNRFFDRAKGATVTMLADGDHPTFGSPEGQDDDSSPANFIGETVGDRLRVATQFNGKVFAAALKSRSSVLLGGRLGQAYWASDATGGMTSSSYYLNELPEWVKAFNARAVPAGWVGKTWERALPESAYTGQDDRPSEPRGGLGPTFPHRLPENGLYRAFSMTPMANDWLVEFVKAAVTAEQLGKRGVPDLLAVGFSANDLLGHAYGPESHEVQDAIVRVDRSIADLLAFLEKHVGGRRNLTVVFTADHGATPTPEYMRSLGQVAGRIKKAQLRGAIEKALSDRFGAGDWVRALEDPSVYLNEKLALERKLDFAEIQQAAGEAARTVPGIASYATRAQLLDGRGSNTPLGRALQLSFHPARSGDVLLVTEPFFFWGKHAEKEEGSTHGSPYRYDSQVPLAFWGGSIRAAVRHEPVDMADVAPTLAALMRLGPPAAADGVARGELLR